MRVLLVEDNKDTLATMAAVLRFESYDIVTATDAVAGLEIAKVYQPEVVLLDIGLPGLNGYELAQALRKQNPNRKLHIAAVTAYNSPEDKTRAAAAGIDTHLPKPAKPDTILRLLAFLRSQAGPAHR